MHFYLDCLIRDPVRINIETQSILYTNIISNPGLSTILDPNSNPNPDPKLNSNPNLYYISSTI